MSDRRTAIQHPLCHGENEIFSSEFTLGFDIIRVDDATWVSAWVAERIAEGSLWHENWKAQFTSVPEKLKADLIGRLETEDFKQAHFGNLITVLAAAADVALVQRTFLRLFELRRIISEAPDQRHELEWNVERQLELLIRALPAQMAVSALSNYFALPIDLIQLDTVARVFSSIAREQSATRPELSDDLRKQFRIYLKNAIASILQIDDFDGEFKARVALVLGLIGIPEDMPQLLELIQGDIARVRRGRAAWARGDRSRLGNGGITACSGSYVRAIVQLDPKNCDAVLLDLLNFQEYERDVATELARLVSPPRDNSAFMRKVDYEQIWRARSSIPEDRHKERRIVYATAMRKRIDTVYAERENAVEKRPIDFRLRTLGLSLAKIDSAGSSDVVLQIMALPDDWEVSPQIEALETLLFSGVTLPTDKVLGIVDPCVRRFRKHGIQENDKWLVSRLLCILPFVDNPATGIEKLRESLPQARMVYGNDLRGVVEALGHSRSDQALPLLRELGSDKDRAKQLGDAWINAVATLDQPESRRLLLSFVDLDQLGMPDDVNFDRDDVLAAQVFQVARRDVAVKRRLLDLCSIDLPSAKRLLLAKVVAQFGTAEAVFAGLNLIDDSAKPPIPRDTWDQVKSAFVERRAENGSANSYTLEPRSADAVRATLFEMSSRDLRRKKSALKILLQIEDWRLDYGRPAGEPRHPAFDSGTAWPPMPNGG